MAQRGSYAKGVAKREQILATALDVIARNGFRRTSVRELADAVGLSQAGLLHYFSSKEELFTEILRKRDEVDAAQLPPRSSSIDALVRLVRHNADVPGLVRLYTQFSADATDPDHQANAFFTERYATMRRLFTESIAEAQRDGTASSAVAPDVLATILIAVVDGLQTQWLLDPAVDMTAGIEALLTLAGVPDAALLEP